MPKRNKARRMPAHVVLPNGMWRFVKRGSKSVSRSTRRRARTKRSVGMARRRYRRSSSSGGLGGLTRGSGMLPSTIKNVAAGWGAASIAEMFGFGGTIPAAVSGYVAGGAMGALGGVGKGYIKGSSVMGGGTQTAYG